MAVKTYDDEEKEQAAQSKSTGGSEWLSGEALAQSQKMKTTTQVVNLSKQTDESAKKIAGRIQNENDRNSFQSEYAYSKSPTYSASEHNILKSLMSTGITHTAGNLNLYEADMDTLVRSVQAIPETERRKSAYAYLKALTKVKDGRFYKAYSFGDTKDPGYLETLDFDKAGYDERVKGYQGIFYLGDGHDEENLRAYVDAYDSQGRLDWMADYSYHETAILCYQIRYDAQGNPAFVEFQAEDRFPAARYALHYTQGETGWVLTGVVRDRGPIQWF